MKLEQYDGRITPAQLSFFAIYSPPLGPTDETFQNQILFYYSRTAREARSHSKGKVEESKQEENEKLRHIGLAQGMVGFARNFSDGEPIDSVETEKSRVLMHELEQDWWVLASVDLTRLPSSLSSSSSSDKSQDSEYSSREVSPAPLLLQQILTAHRTFSLHHGPSLEEMFIKLPRDKFCAILDRFWTRFCRNWEVLLHGNPATDVFGGLKLAAGGELGFGVGEEEWGSGEREVLEGLVHDTEGLVDLNVSRFGEAAPPEPDYQADKPSAETVEDSESGTPWLGCGHSPQAPDGVIFGGTGAITRASLRDISAWVQDIYKYGEYAYGVKDNPHRQRRKRRRRQPVVIEEDDDEEEEVPTSADDTDLRRKVLGKDLHVPLPHDPRPQMHDRVASQDHATGSSTPQVASHPGIPPPIVSAAEASLDQAISDAAKTLRESPSDSKQESTSSYGISDKWVKYLSFGLASTNKAPPPDKRPDARRTSTSSSKTVTNSTIPKAEVKKLPIMQHLDPAPDGHDVIAYLARQKQLESDGHFLIGYRGDLDRTFEDGDDQDNESTESDTNLLRTLKVELSKDDSSNDESDQDLSRQSTRTSWESNSQRLRVLVYIHRPFIYVFLFEQRTPSLQMTSFYKHLHKHLRPLHKSLLNSTSLSHVAERIASAHTSPPVPLSVNPQSPPFAPPHTSPVFDLVFDPITLTIHTSLPNIPEPGSHLPANGGMSTSSSGFSFPPQWTRLEALNVHSHILATLHSVSRSPLEVERTSKTSRHWWVVWMRVPQQAATGHPRVEECRTAFLVRKARDHVTGQGVASRVSSGMFGFGRGNGEDATAGWGSAAALAGGIGIDARKYVESLLSLNR